MRERSRERHERCHANFVRPTDVRQLNRRRLRRLRRSAQIASAQHMSVWLMLVLAVRVMNGKLQTMECRI